MADALGIVDYVVIAIVLAIFVLCGLYFNRRSSRDNTMNNFLLGNRAMAVIPVAISVVATRYSAIGMTGGTGEVYKYGVEFTIAKYASALGNVAAAFLIVPVFHGMEYVSMYEYVEKRFNRPLRIVYATVYLIGETLYMSIVLYVPAISLSTVTGMSLWISLFLSAAVCIVYSTLGGTKAVIWTDVIQTGLMVGCFLLIIIKGTYDAGGATRVWDLGVKGQRITHFTLHEDPNTRYSVWSLFFDGVIMSIATLCTKQAVVQRFLSVHGKKEARSVTLLSALVTAMFAVLVAAAGVVIYANYYDCDPLQNTKVSHIKDPDQLLVYYATQSLNILPGLQGLALVGLFSGSLSTMSSFINSFAAITVQDFIKIICPNALSSENSSVLACRLLTIFYGLVCVGLAFFVPQLGGVIKMANTIKGATVGPLFGILCLGIFVRKANAKGAFFGLIVGLALNMWIVIGSKTIKKNTTSLPLDTYGCMSVNTSQSVYENETSDLTTTWTPSFSNHSSSYHFPLYNISFMWYGPLAVLTTFTLGVIASLITGGKKNVDERLLSPVLSSKHHSSKDISLGYKET